MPQQFEGYPLAVFYFLGILGLILIIFQPRWAFLMSVFCLAARHHFMALFTRTPFFGEYLNLNDLFLWIGVGAFVRVALQGEKIWFPKVLAALLLMLCVGTAQSLYYYGFHYLVMQSIWAALVFPIMFAVSVNLVRTEKDARAFVWTLFLGGVAAALHHIFFLNINYAVSDYLVSVYGLSVIRTVGFMNSGAIFLVISSFFVNMKNLLKRYLLFLFWLIGLALIITSYLLSFSRTVWVGAVLSTITLIIIIYWRERKLYSKLFYAFLIILLTFVSLRILNALLSLEVDILRLVNERMDFVRYEDSFEEAYSTRRIGMFNEIKWWLDGSIIWGMGTSYPPAYIKPVHEGLGIGAVNHVAFSAYLAHFGLIGLLLYGLFLPVLTLRVGRSHYLQHQRDYRGVVGIMGMALALFDIFTLASNNLYIVNTVHVPGLIYGAIWGVSRIQKKPAPVWEARGLPLPSPRGYLPVRSGS